MTTFLKNPNVKRRAMLFAGNMILLFAWASLLLFLHSFLTRHGVIHTIRPLKAYPLYLCLPVHALLCYIFDAYDVRVRGRLPFFTLLLIIHFLAAAMLFGLAKILRINQTTFVYILLLYGGSLPMMYGWRLALRKRLLRSRDRLKSRILFLGSDCTTSELIGIMRHRDFEIVGMLGPSNCNSNEEDPLIPHLGGFEMLQEILSLEHVDQIITAADIDLPLPILKQIYQHSYGGIEVYDSDYFYEILSHKVAIQRYIQANAVPYLDLHPFINSPFKNAKRMFDITFSLLGLILLSPLFVLLMALVKCTSRGPVFFVQTRVGFQDKDFSIIKFRTMVHDAEKATGPAWACKGDSRVTAVGRFLRKTHLDELPQLISILTGNMSLVGPRPFRRHFVDKFEEVVPFYSLKFSVKPGLTGWAQVNHQCSGDIPTTEDNIERLQYDLYYIKHASMFLDIFILLKTVQAIIQRPAY